MMLASSTPVRRARGQAMMEFLIALIALVPLFLLIAMLGKYLDIKSTIVQGARYAAWERTVWYGDSNDSRSNSKSTATLQNELRERLFSDTATTVQADDGATREAPRAAVNANWNDYSNKAILLPVYTGTTGATTNRGDPGALGKGLDVLLLALNTVGTVGSFGTSSFGPNTHGLYTAQLQVKLNQPPQVVRGLRGMGAWTDPAKDSKDAKDAKDAPLVFGAGSGPNYGSNVLLADAWSAGGPESAGDRASVHNQVSGLVPTSWAAGRVAMEALALKPSVDGISAAGVAMDPGKIAPDVIPPDRRK